VLCDLVVTLENHEIPREGHRRIKKIILWKSVLIWWLQKFPDVKKPKLILYRIALYHISKVKIK
jgi:hypothetical protein